MSSATAAVPGRRRPAARSFNPPWRDRGGRFVPIKAVVLFLVCLPALVLAYWAITRMLGGRPVMEAIYHSGLWAIRLLTISLAITPLAAVLALPRLLLVRRMVGVAAMAYALLHLSLYVIDENFRLGFVASEILHRFYLTIGFVTLLGLVTLGATSTDAALRRLGANWKRLHRLAYGLILLAALHYFLQTKANVSEAVMLTGFVVWLLAWRAAPAGAQRSAWIAAPLLVLATAATMAIEFAWYATMTRIDPWRVLAVNETLRYGLRPAHIVALAGAAVLALALTRRHLLPRLV
ncbi:MAG: ferric reductase-like transmembrane domain-containing protein [Rhodospirillales bacterium]|nr:ferric reductase-like transmembrane domain-containing protein [Rhodospirillales bacterium]